MLMFNPACLGNIVIEWMLWELDDESQCTFQISKAKGVFFIINTLTTHSLLSVGSGKSFAFSTLQLSNITNALLPPNATNGAQPLD